MSHSDEAQQYATTTDDLYALLDVSPDTTEKEVYRAWRKTALKFHPDQNQDDPEAAAKFHSMTLARDVLSSADLKQIYDNTRSAREHKKKATEALDKERRSAIEQLEKAEAESKRKEASLNDEEIKIRRIAERNAQLRHELTLKRKREFLAAQTAHASAEPVTKAPVEKVLERDDSLPYPDGTALLRAYGGTPKRSRQETMDRMRAFQHHKEEKMAAQGASSTA